MRKTKPPVRTRAAKAEPKRRTRVYRPAAERRVEILEAARAVFIRCNFQGARTRDIAEQAGVNEATLFKHFPSKEALFEAAVIQPLHAAMRNMHERIETYETAKSAEELGVLAEASTARHLEDMQRVFPLLVTALFSDLDMGRKLYRQQLAPLIRQRGAVLRTLVKDGIEPEFVGLATFGMLFAVAMQHWFGERQQSAPVIAAQFNRLSTQGFARVGNTRKRSVRRKSSK